MINTKRCWAPKTVPSNLRALLAVPLSSNQEVTPALHRQLLLVKLRRLVAEAGEDAARALEMSPEHLPELLAIQQREPQSNWAVAILNSDLMMAQLGKINWSKENSLTSIHQAEIREQLQEQTLQSLLETL